VDETVHNEVDPAGNTGARVLSWVQSAWVTLAGKLPRDEISGKQPIVCGFGTTATFTGQASFAKF